MHYISESTPFFQLDSDRTDIALKDAAVAIITIDDEALVMQLRDTFPKLLFPGYWGFFGGALETGESPFDGLRRELREELAIDVTTATYFTAVDYDFSFCGRGWFKRHYFIVPLERRQLGDIRLGEGAGWREMSIRDVLAEPKVVPFDHWALWLYANRHSLANGN